MNLLSVSISLLLVAQACAAQSNGSVLSRFSFIVTGGVELTEPAPQAITSLALPPNISVFTTATNFESRRYTVGPAIEFAINRHFAVEFSPLYKRLGLTTTENAVGTAFPLSGFFATRSRANAWEFPVLAKYYFGNGGGIWRAFVGVGPSWELSWQHSEVNTALLDPATGAPLSLQPILFNPSFRTPVRPGIVFDGGLVLQTGRIGIAPEIRYTKWGGLSSSTDPRDADQAEILVTIRFDPK